MLAVSRLTANRPNPGRHSWAGRPPASKVGIAHNLSHLSILAQLSQFCFLFLLTSLSATAKPPTAHNT